MGKVTKLMDRELHGMGDVRLAVGVGGPPVNAEILERCERCLSRALDSSESESRGTALGYARDAEGHLKDLARINPDDLRIQGTALRAAHELRMIRL